MRRRKVSAALLAACLVLGACAPRPTPYQPRDGGFGYAQTQIDSHTWRVDFAGNADTPRETVENYLLYRAAEVMLFGGHDRFVVLEKDVERTREYHGAGFHPYHGGGGVGLGHHRRRGRHGYLFYGHGHPYGFAADTYRAYATVRTYSGGPPPAGLQVYAARDVIARLGRTVVLPD